MSELSNSHDGSVIEKLSSGEAGALVEQTEERFEMRFNYLGWPLIVRLIPQDYGNLAHAVVGQSWPHAVLN